MPHYRKDHAWEGKVRGEESVLNSKRKKKKSFRLQGRSVKRVSINSFQERKHDAENCAGKERHRRGKRTQDQAAGSRSWRSLPGLEQASGEKTVEFTT